MNVSPKQIVLIHVAKNKLAMTDDNYRNLLEGNFEVRSSKDLDSQQATELIAIFVSMGFDKEEIDSTKARQRKPRTRQALHSPSAEESPSVRGLNSPSAQDPPSDPDATITPAQQAVIAGFVKLLQWKPDSIRGCSTKIIKKPWPQTRKDGQKLIMALLSMNAKELSRAVWNMRSNKNLTTWERNFLFGHDKCAEKELERFANAKGKRGQRTMPNVSLSKLFEIYQKRNPTIISSSPAS